MRNQIKSLKVWEDVKTEVKITTRILRVKGSPPKVKMTEKDVMRTIKNPLRVMDVRNQAAEVKKSHAMTLEVGGWR